MPSLMTHKAAEWRNGFIILVALVPMQLVQLFVCLFLEAYLIKFRKTMQSIYIINNVNLLSYLQNNEAKNSVDEINIKRGKNKSGDER